MSMHTSLDVPTALLEEARRTLGFKSRTDTVVLALRELLRTERAAGRLTPIEPERGRRSIRRKKTRTA